MEGGKLAEFAVESAILNIGFLVEYASPRPSHNRRQEGQLWFILGGGLAERRLLEIFEGGVGRIGGAHGPSQLMELVAEC